MTEPQAENKRPSLADMVNQVYWQKESKQLYTAFIDALGTIPDADVRADCCLSVVKYEVSRVVSDKARAVGLDGDDEASDNEVAKMFDQECKRFCDDLMKISAMYPKFLEVRRAMKRSGPEISIADLIGIVLGSCECEHCKASRQKAH